MSDHLHELYSLPQWVVAADDKVPYDPKMPNRKASVTDSATWGTHEQAGTLLNGHFKHLGLVLTAEDPYTIIDLDNKPGNPLTQEQAALHQRVLSSFPSYTERSCSGLGYHIIVRGKVPAGVHSRDKVEIYSTGHYLICTGAVVRDVPIADCQPLLDQLYVELKGNSPTSADLDESGPELLSDRDLVEMAARADNAEKFNMLCNGRWEEVVDAEGARLYPSQSEADFALLGMLCFYTRNNAQVRRLFRYSRLGKREKAQKNNVYLDRCLEKLRANEPPRVDASALLAKVVPSHALDDHEEDLPSLPGLLGDVERYIFESSSRPLREVSMAAALALGAGIFGRQYNTAEDPTGLNLYIINLGETGIGKEGAKNGIARCVAAVRQTIPSATEILGPEHFASGQALLKKVAERPCFLSIIGECGHTLKRITSPHAFTALQK